MKLRVLFLLTIVCLTFSWALAYTPDGNGRIYVNQTVSTDGQGNSWGTAAKDLADVLNSIYDGTTTGATEIWVASGTYYPKYNPSNKTADGSRNITFYIPVGIAVYGGFAGNESTQQDKENRDWKTNATTLSGDIGVLSTNTDNAYHVVLITQDNITLDGFTITEGYAEATYGTISVDSRTISRHYGTGIHVLGTSTTSIQNTILRNLTITENTTAYSGSRGAGIYLSYTNGAVMSNLTIKNNASATSGGGIYIDYSSDIAIKDSDISRNSGTSSGAGIYASPTGDLTMTNVTVSENFITNGNGAGISYRTNAAGIKLRMTDVDISRNYATGSSTSDGIGIYLYGQGDNIPDVTMNNVTISDNHANVGGSGVGIGVLNAGAIITADNLTVSGNYATSGTNCLGAGIYLRGGSTTSTFENTKIYGNKTPQGKGGGIYTSYAAFSMNNSQVYDNIASETGGIHLTDGSPTITITNSKIYGNQSTATSTTASPGGIYFSLSSSTLSFKNSLIYGNLGGTRCRDISLANISNRSTITFENTTVVSNDSYPSVYIDGNHDIILKNSIIATSDENSLAVYDNRTTNRNTYWDLYNSYIQIPDGVANTPNISSDENGIPGTTNPTSFFVATGNDYCQLADCSPLINAGNNGYVTNGDTDVLENARINGEIVDIGAYEYTGTLFPQAVKYDSTKENNGGQSQNVNQGAAIQDIWFYYSLGTTDVSETGLPNGVTLVKDASPDANGNYHFKLTGTPNDGPGVYNYTITTSGTDCPEEASIEGIIFVTPVVTPDVNGVVYVKKGASGDGSGSSWDNAVPNLADAILGADDNEDVKQIWVGRGSADALAGQPSTFIPKYHIAELDWDDKATTDEDKTFLLVDGVKIFGGFDPENGIEDLTQQRDSSLTILSGEISSGVNAYHVVTALNQNEVNSAGEENHIVIDGFSITGGNANGTSEIALTYNILQNAGAGIYAEAGDGFISIRGNYIYENTAGGESAAGGGIYASGYVQIINNTIADNQISGNNSMGGGIAAAYKESSGGGASRMSNESIQALALDDDLEHVQNLRIAYNRVINNTVSGNYVSGGGIVINLSGGDQNQRAVVTSDNAIQVLYNIITGNKAKSVSNEAYGGGITMGQRTGSSQVDRMLRSSSAELEKSVSIDAQGDILIGYNWIAQNESDKYGGGIYTNLPYENTVVLNNVIVENTAITRGGGIYLDDNTSLASLNNTISANNSPIGAGVYYGYAIGSFYNTIIAGNLNGVDLYLNYNEYEEYLVDDYLLNNLIGTYEDDNNIANPPASGDDFGNKVGVDPEFTGGDDNDLKYTVLSSSPAVNAGNNTVWGYLVTTDEPDFAGSARIRGVIDMGAYEIYCPTDIIPDINGIVYVKDYSQDMGESGSVAGAGNSWEDAHPSLADVLQVAYNYPGCIQEIWVAEGIHKPEHVPAYSDPVEGDAISERDQTFLMASGVHVFGGFPSDATTEKNNDKDDITHRNWNVWKTTLSGDIDNSGDATGNVHHVVVADDLTEATELNGFIITGGNADGNGSFYIVNKLFRNYGGGINCLSTSSNSANSLYVKNTIITQNNALYSGGGIYASEYANPVFVNTLIDNNTADSGAGVYIWGRTRPASRSAVELLSAISASVPTFTNVTIADNTASSNGGGIYLYVGDYNRTIAINNTIIWGNTTDGIYRNGGSDTNTAIVTSIIQGVDGMDTDPLFADADNADYRLQPTSPAIDGGTDSYYQTAVGGSIPTNEKELSASNRISGTAIDMGAYELEANVTLDLRIFLQGPTVSDGNGGAKMTNYTQLGNENISGFESPKLPQTNPYDIKDENGTDVIYEDINDINGVAGEIVDWIQVEIWKVTDDLTSRTEISETRALLLKPDGSVVDINGELPTFDSQEGNVHIIVKHRNHMGILSQSIADFTGLVEYDFTTASNKALIIENDDPVQMVLVENVWCLWAGEMTNDHTIDSADMSIFNNEFNRGLWNDYIWSDFNMDGSVDSSDASLIKYSFNRGLYSILSYFE